MCFFFNDPATTEIYTYGHTLSLHAALPILPRASSPAFSSLRNFSSGSILHRAVRWKCGTVCLLSVRRRAIVLRMLESFTASTGRSEEHTSELQSLMRISYAVFCLKKKKTITKRHNTRRHLRYSTEKY